MSGHCKGQNSTTAKLTSSEKKQYEFRASAMPLFCCTWFYTLVCDHLNTQKCYYLELLKTPNCLDSFWQSNWAQRKHCFATGLLWAHKLPSKRYNLRYHKVFCSRLWFLKSRKMPINLVLSRYQNSFNRPPTSSSIWTMLFAWSFLPSLRKITLNQNNLLLQQHINCVQAWKRCFCIVKHPWCNICFKPPEDSVPSFSLWSCS